MIQNYFVSTIERKWIECILDLNLEIIDKCFEKELYPHRIFGSNWSNDNHKMMPSSRRMFFLPNYWFKTRIEDTKDFQEFERQAKVILDTIDEI